MSNLSATGDKLHSNFDVITLALEWIFSTEVPTLVLNIYFVFGTSHLMVHEQCYVVIALYCESGSENQ